jgi:hypothetical protein
LCDDCVTELTSTGSAEEVAAGKEARQATDGQNRKARSVA